MPAVSPDSSENPFVSRFFNETQKIATDSGTMPAKKAKYFRF
jgi:hypothetical protein